MRQTDEKLTADTYAREAYAVYDIGTNGDTGSSGGRRRLRQRVGFVGGQNLAFRLGMRLLLPLAKCPVEPGMAGSGLGIRRSGLAVSDLLLSGFRPKFNIYGVKSSL